MKLLVLLPLILLLSCSAKKTETITFVERKYSNKTTEIVDQIIFELLGKRYCYESSDDYSLRTGKEFIEYETNTENNEVVKRYMQERRILSKKTLIVVKNVMPSICEDTIYMKALKANINSVFQDDNTVTADGRTEEFRLSESQKNIYNQLLNDMKVADLSVSEMANTGCLQLSQGTGREHQFPVNKKPAQYIDGYLTVSKAVVSDDGNEACLFYEYIAGPKSGIGCIIFVGKTARRWHLIREVMIWIS